MKRPPCNLCASTRGELVKKGVYGNPRQNVFRCRACGHMYLAPFLSDEEEEAFYLDEYPAFLLKRGDAKNASPAEHFTRNRGEAVRRLGLVGGLLRRRHAVLEIGSATGYFLHALKGKVDSVRGVEPNAAHAAFANGRGVPTDSDVRSADGRRFDLVFLYYVLEHVKEPHGFLRQIRRLLRGRGAKLILEVPNGDEALVSLYRSRAYDDFVWQRAHCSYFTPRVLSGLLNRHGFKTRLVPVQRYDISNHLVWLAEGRSGGQGRYKQFFSAALEDEYRECLRRHWLCDSIMAVAELR